MIRTKYTIPAALTGIWLCMALLVDPIGDFPLGDDWSYGRVVKTLVETGSFQYTDWVSMPLFAQAIWGALFCLPFGFSFTALRISTLVLGLVGILATFLLLRRLGARRNAAFLSALIVATNPLYFALSHSFFTDVPFYALTALSFLLFAQGIESGRVQSYAGGIALASLAVLTRQMGVVLPIAVAVAVIAKQGVSRKTVLLAVTPPLIVFCVYLGYNWLVEVTIGQSMVYNLKMEEFVGQLRLPLSDLLWNAFSRASTALLYLGLFLLPASSMSLPGRWRLLSARHRSISLAVIVIFVSLPAAYLLSVGRLMPVGDNWLYDFGLGTPTLTDVFLLELENLDRAPEALWIVVTIFSLAGSGLLMESLASMTMRAFSTGEENAIGSSQRWIPVSVWTFLLVYLAPLMIAGFFDRYLIALMPFLLIPMAARSAESRPAGGAGPLVFASVLVSMLAFFSIAATRDYLSWNRARWEALDYLVEQRGTAPDRIDGGFEFNGWHFDPASGVKPKRRWWVYDDTYMVTFGPVRGYEMIERFPYQRWLWMDEGSILILKRVPSYRSPPLRGSD